MADAPYTSQRNSFHLMRFVLAALVLLCHSYTLLGRTTPLSGLTGGQINEGTMAVDGFLVISGFLICQSSLRSKNPLTFLGKRVLRLAPAFLCALCFSALIVGGLAYAGDYRSYLTMGDNGPLTWIWNWLTLNVRGEQWGVTGVFATNPTTSLNVSLWTIKHEIFLYLLMALLMLTTLNRRRPTYMVLYAFFLLAWGLLEGLHLRLWNVADVRWWVLSQWNYPRFMETGLFFFTGVMLYAYRQELPRRWYLALISALLMILFGLFGLMKWVYPFALPYLVIYLASSPLCQSFSRLGDLSLGMYVYSYPIQQLLYHIAPTLPPMAHFGLTLLVVLPLAALSWKCIEAPALRLKTLGHKAQ